MSTVIGKETTKVTAAAGRLPRDIQVACLERMGKFRVAEPFFGPGPRVPVHPGSRREAEPGDLVLVRVESGRARIVRRLGKPDCPRDVVEALMLDRGLARAFGRDVESEAAESVASPPDVPRRDLRELPAFTIDPSEAKDFDDAISVERAEEGVRVYVHIADVSAYVAPGSVIDTVARQRGCSIYVPGQVEPMLPMALSANACSLVPGEPRAAVTVEMLVDGDGNVTKASFYRSTICSTRRLSYAEVDSIFAGIGRAPAEVGLSLDLARRVASRRLKLRHGRGALALDTGDIEIEFDSEGQVADARRMWQSESHGLIEELMIMANEQVARFLERKGKGLLYRVHEQPEPEAVDFLVDQLASLDVPTPPVPERMSPSQAGELAGRISLMLEEQIRRAGSGREALTALLLRSLKQAVYSPHNIGHAGLASSSYCHFTSPIRRYPDLVVHRALLDAIGADGFTYSLAELEECGWHSSAMEREAAKLEYDAADVCLAFLLERELYESGWDHRFEGEVVGLVPAGAFVAFGVYEGFLPARQMRGDYFKLNDEGTALVGRRTGSTLRLADPVTVVVDRIQYELGRVDLRPASQETWDG